MEHQPASVNRYEWVPLPFIIRFLLVGCTPYYLDAENHTLQKGCERCFIMSYISPRIGDWVSFYSSNDKRYLSGFIVNKILGSQNYVIFVPVKNRQYYGSESSFTVEEPVLLREDVLALIDLALDLKDENWFMELIKRL